MLSTFKQSRKKERRRGREGKREDLAEHNERKEVCQSSLSIRGRSAGLARRGAPGAGRH